MLYIYSYLVCLLICFRFNRLFWYPTGSRPRKGRSKDSPVLTFSTYGKTSPVFQSIHQVIRWASGNLLLREKMFASMTAMGTKQLDWFERNFAYRFFRAKSRSSSLMGKIALSVSKRRSFQILKETYSNKWQPILKNCSVFIMESYFDKFTQDSLHGENEGIILKGEGGLQPTWRLNMLYINLQSEVLYMNHELKTKERTGNKRKIIVKQFIFYSI